MAYDKALQTNIDNSNPAAYPDAQIKDNDGTSDGTPVARVTMSDQFEFFAKIMRLAGLTYNNQYDNETNGYQYVQALQALANKNDLVQPLTAGTATIGGVSTPILILANLKIETLLVGEIIIAQPAADYASQTTISGSTSGTYKSVTSTAYKANDFLILVNGSGGITIQTIVTTSTLDFMVTALAYLKAASNSDTVAGTSTTTAVTPASFLYALTKFLTDNTDSVPYLATESTNGLLSAADKTSIDALAALKNKGYVSGMNPGYDTVGSTLAVSGDIASCTTATKGSGGPGAFDNTYTIVMNNAMSNTNYYVKMFAESLGGIGNDDDCLLPVFKIISTTSFSIAFGASIAGTRSIKMHLEVIQS